ncbi:MAG: M48 family metalloprotease [Planctomycetota bacterium]
MGREDVRCWGRRKSAVLGVGLLAGLAAGCTIGDVAGNLAGNAVGGRAGELARAAVSSAADSVQQMRIAFSPEQEYVVGRAAAAELIARFGLDPNPGHQAYVKTIGATLVALSTRITPTHGGYHFGVLDDDAPNGWSAPGGFVFVTRGALLRAENEDEIAGILAHEIAHVSLKHAETIIVRGREAGSTAAAFGRILGAAGGNQGVLRSQAEMLGDVSGAMVASLTRQGYGYDAEYEADREGTLILYDAGYDARALRAYLSATENRPAGTWDTHPPSANRTAALDPVLATYGGDFDTSDASDRAVRAERYARVMAGGPVVVEEPAPAPPEGP